MSGTPAGAHPAPQRPRWWQPRRWLPEAPRAWLSAVIGALAMTPLGAHRLGEHIDRHPGDGLGLVTIFVGLFTGIFLVYMLVYIVVSLWAFRGVDDATCLSWARSTRRGTRIERWFYATDPGAGVATVVAFVALLAAISGNARALWGEEAPEWVGAAATVAIAVCAWVSVVLTYSIDYMCRDQREDGPHLDFPGGVQGWRDYVYFSVAATTTFGATDVTVETSAMRRTVTTHAILAFVFNTVILAIVIGQFA